MRAVEFKQPVPRCFSQRLMKKGVRFWIHVVSVVSLLAYSTALSGCASAVLIDKSLQDRALEGNREAQYQIGEIYYRARYAAFGRSAYWEDAARWYLMAADQGDARAHYRLSQYYFNKQSDYTQSFRWLQLPAQEGIAEAQHSLGMHYAQGWGTPQDLVLAYKWIQLSFEGSISDPKNRVVGLEWLIEKGRMSPEQIDEATSLAKIHTERYGRSRSLDPGRRTLLEMR